MEYYVLSELRENLNSHLQGLGVSSKFLDNPAYDALSYQLYLQDL